MPRKYLSVFALAIVCIIAVSDASTGGNIINHARRAVHRVSVDAWLEYGALQRSRNDAALRDWEAKLPEHIAHVKRISR